MKRARHGFTLIELMITVAIVAILAAIAWPSYQAHVLKSRRAETQAHLMALAARQQQFLIDTRAYAGELATIGISAPTNVAAAYTLVLTAPAVVTPSFTLTATPVGGQSREPCGTLSINNTGTKTAASSSCW